MIIKADALTEFAARIIAAAGSLPPEAQEVANHLVEANLKGHDSHGVGMIPHYVKNLRANLLHPNTHATLVSETGSIAVFDGGMGYGQVTAREATEWAIAKAKATGLGVFTLRNTHHVARVGAYGEMAVAAGLISIQFVNVVIAPGRVAPFGGVTGRFGTDPVCISFPGTDKVPPVVLLDEQGNDATDPAVFYRKNGSMLPFGEHKGSGLALMCELLGGVLTGGGAMQGNLPNRGIKNGMFTIVLDPARFGDAAWMRQEMETLIGWVKSSPPRPGVERVMVAGEPERRSRDERLETGIPIDANTWKELVEAAQLAGVS